jgi:hypothetical protein
MRCVSPRHASVSREFSEQGCEILGIDARPGRIHYKVVKLFSRAFCLLPVHIYVSIAIVLLARVSLVRFLLPS